MDFLLKQIHHYMPARAQITVKIRDRGDPSRHETHSQALTMIHAYYGSDAVATFTEKEFQHLLARHEFTYLIVAELYHVIEPTYWRHCPGQDQCLTAQASESRWHPDEPCTALDGKKVAVMAESFDRGIRKLLEYANAHCKEPPRDTS